MPDKKPANTERRYTVTAEDLPVSCPRSDMVAWNSHPRVFLPFVDNEAVCPYCDAVFVLTKPVVSSCHRDTCG